MERRMSQPAVQPVDIGRYFPDDRDAQAQADIAVVIPTIGRDSLKIALRSIYQQSAARIQILIGLDRPIDCSRIYDWLAQRPSHVSAVVLNLPYSTSVRHGGPHVATDGGGLRSALSFMANSRYVAYLDDDNAWEEDHLSGLLDAVRGKAWAFAHRYLVSEESGKILAVDRWDSVGPNKGRFRAQGGLVDPNCLMVDKVAVARHLGRWSETSNGQPSATADRHFFAAISQLPFGEVTRPTVRYGIRPTNVMNRFIADNTIF